MSANSSWLYRRPSNYIQNSVLVLFAFATAFFPRILNSVGLPSAINFVHFLIVPLACTIVIAKTKVKNKSQIAISEYLIFGLLILLISMTASALLNKAGVINLFLEFLLLTEPFIVILTIVCLPLSPKTLKRFRAWVLGFIGIHIFLAFAQWLFIKIGILAVTRMQPTDNVQGVFYLSGSGHVVGSSVSLSFGLYYLFAAKNAPKWLRVSIFGATFFQLLFADAKQVLLVFVLAWFLLILLRLNDIRTTLQYIIGGILISYALYWCIYNVDAFSAFRGWIRPELYGPDGAATLLKLAPLRIIPTFYKSPLNLLFGLGPGHSVERLGGFMLNDYSALLKPLGATTHPATQAVWNAFYENSWLNSSFFSPFWGWAGIWGDLGILGLGFYLYLAFIVWRRLCLDDLSRFTMLTVLLFGFIFTQLEEPGYMLSMAILIGLRWHELQVHKLSLPTISNEVQHANR
ncbi:hypothetical protein [Nostoc sp. 106C]|uniref:hypothetical protein n=1 Tax=Nostoc sp. 106C TaxID=1932667 RepID=UPI000A385C33|nr:hypothetical protein [Nostoc sp. 106C]OUL26028.1 hypothetical protein BV378_13815 [Nostoc sp. RF31YmG]OUL31391.1 hypothetical protein BV375_12195 [Nostoc sp. 106C]